MNTLSNLKFKDNFIGYFNFYYKVIGYRILVNLGLCIIVSFLDGIGLTMFMPLLQMIGTGSTHAAGRHSMGQLHYITDAVQAMGFSLNLNTVLVLMVILFSFKGAIKYVQLRYQVNLRQLFMRRVRFNLVGGLHNLSYQGFLKMDAGKIQNTLLAEVQRLFQTMNFYFTASQYAVMMATYIALAFLANYQFALLVGIGAGITNFLYRRIYVKTKTISKKLSRKGDAFNSFLLQAVHHFKYLKATNYFNRFDDKLKQVILQTEKLNRRMGIYNAITISLKEPMVVGIVVLVIYLQVNLLGTGLSSILLSLLLFYRSLTFLVAVQNHWQNFIQNSGAIYSITNFLATMKEMKEEQPEGLLTSFRHGLRLKHVHFSYGEKKILNDISIEIPKNKSIAFVGESGSGKTTLANLITGLIQPNAGALLVDGLPLTDFNTDSYRNRIGYISQEPVIFNDNIFNNITFWDKPTPENVTRFHEVIELSSLKVFLNSLPEKELTQLGDNGFLISGGQKQRISIARELYKRAEILILDEATSALDSETEKMIQENLEQLRGSYTMIIIAHRLSTIKNADVIYLLEKGNITASGNFGDMLQSSNRFKHMVALQEF